MADPTPNPDAAPKTAPMELVYDGRCPMCNFYVRRYRAAPEAGGLTFTDARQAPDTVAHLRAEGMDLDAGMVLLRAGRAHHGADALTELARLAEPKGLFNRLNAGAFRSAALARLAYPMLVTMRAALLWLLGRGRIG